MPTDIKLTLDDDTLNAVAYQANRRGVTVVEWIREVIEWELDLDGADELDEADGTLG